MPLPYTKLNPNVQTKKGVGKARYAPHKPLLLLSLIDLAEEGAIGEARLEKTAALRLRFEAFWAICQPRWGGSRGNNYNPSQPQKELLLWHARLGHPGFQRTQSPMRPAGVPGGGAEPPPLYLHPLPRPQPQLQSQHLVPP